MDAKVTVFVVDDDASIRDSLRYLLESLPTFFYSRSIPIKSAA